MAAKVLVLIPAHNEAKTIAEVLSALRSAAPDFDRVVVNDGSKDDTGRVVERMGEKQLHLPCNLGYGKALQTGLKYALARKYDVVSFIDADGQHDPRDVPRLIQFLRDSRADVVIGSRFCNDRPYTGPFSRRLAQTALSHLTGLLMDHRIFDTTSGLKALRAPAFAELVSGTFQDFHIETLVRLSLFGFKIVEMPINVKQRSHGQSMYSALDVVEYPMKTLLLTLVAAVDAALRGEAMTTQGVVLIDLMGLALIVLLVNLVRTQKLYVGYAVIWLFAVAGMMLTISFPPLLRFVTRAVGALFPVSALSLLAFVFIFATLIFFSVKLSALSARQAELVQLLALKDVLNQERASGESPDAVPREKG